MDMLTHAVRLFLAHLAIDQALAAKHPALNDILYVRDEENPKNLVIVNQNESSIEFGVASNDPSQTAVATHILSLEKDQAGKSCLVLAYYNHDGKIVDIGHIVVEGEEDYQSRLLRLYQLAQNTVLSFENLVERCLLGQEEFYIALGGGIARSSKNICLVDDEITSLDFTNLPSDLELSVFNEIDDSEVIVNRTTIGEQTNIMTAIANESMFAY